MSRKLKLQVQMSIDGFIAGRNGEMDWITWNWDDNLKDYVDKLTNSVDTILLGRKLAEGFIPHWESVASDPNNPEVDSGKLFTNTPKVVFTNSLKKSEWNNTELNKSELSEEINKLKSGIGKDIIVYGGAEFVSNLLKEELVDELHLFINPTAIGKGMSIFSKLQNQQSFKLENSQMFTCGINVLVYTKSK